MANRLARYVSAQPRLSASALFGLLAWLLAPRDWRATVRLLVAWDLATGLYLVLAAAMMARSDIGRMRRRAARQDVGGVAILILTNVTAIVSLAAIVAELTTARAAKGREVWPHIALAGATVLLSWTFTHTIFALHYAHEYYLGPAADPAAGLDFPGREPPDYWDFAYYAFVIGTACATADVDVTSKRMRRTTAAHGVVAFFFNTTILALLINIGSGFF